MNLTRRATTGCHAVHCSVGIRIVCAFVAIAALAAAPPPVVEIRRDIEARATFDRGEIRLSGEVELRLTVEAPGPLSVTPAKPFLEAGSWRVREVGLPVREIMDNGREKWAQVYRLSPLIFGKVPIAIGPLKVTSGSQPEMIVVWDEARSAIIHVLEPKMLASVDSLKPPTDLEDVPPPTPDVRDSSPGWFAVVPVLVLVGLILLVVASRKRVPPSPRDAAWAWRELGSSELSPERCAIVLRQFLAFQYAIPAETRTTPELADDLKAEGKLGEDEISEWRTLLDECDAARFSGTAILVASLAERAQAIVYKSAAQLNPSQ